MKKILSIFLCLILLSCTLVVNAAEMNNFVTAHELQDSTLLLYSVVLPQNGKLSVTIKDNQVSDTELSTVRKEHLPVTVYCLVDLSSAMSKQQIQQQIDALKIISSRMGEQDSMVITTVGKKITEGAILDTYEARMAAIETLKHDNYSVDYYQGIIDAVGSLQSKTTYNTNRCLLLLSDGARYKQSNATQQDAINAVSKVDYPVYVIATSGSDASQAAANDAGKIIKIANASTGGLGLIPAKESITAGQAAEKIWENIQESTVIKIDLKNVSVRENNTSVHAVYEVNDTRFETSVVVDLANVTFAEEDNNQPDVTAVVETEGTEAIADAETDLLDSTSTAKDWIVSHIVLIAFAILVLAAFAVAGILSFKKKKTEPVPDVQDPDKPKDPNIIFEDDILPKKFPKTTPVDAGGKKITVQMTVTSHRNVNVKFDLSANVAQILGRDDRADIIVNAEDNQLSGRHCSVEWDGSYLCIQDVGSTNGTRLNGELLKPNTWNQLETGSVISMGSFDYLVTLHHTS